MSVVTVFESRETMKGGDAGWTNNGKCVQMKEVFLKNLGKRVPVTMVNHNGESIPNEN